MSVLALEKEVSSCFSSRILDTVISWIILRACSLSESPQSRSLNISRTLPNASVGRPSISWMELKSTSMSEEEESISEKRT